MKKFFDNEDKEKEKDKIIELSFGMDFDEIKQHFEDVDNNGEEKIEENNQDKNKETPISTEASESKKKKKKNKKK